MSEKKWPILSRSGPYLKTVQTSLLTQVKRVYMVSQDMRDSWLANAYIWFIKTCAIRGLLTRIYGLSRHTQFVAS
jgi:hypothetical protein